MVIYVEKEGFGGWFLSFFFYHAKPKPSLMNSGWHVRVQLCLSNKLAGEGGNMWDDAKAYNFHQLAEFPPNCHLFQFRTPALHFFQLFYFLN